MVCCSPGIFRGVWAGDKPTADLPLGQDPGSRNPLYWSDPDQECRGFPPRQRATSSPTPSSFFERQGFSLERVHRLECSGSIVSHCNLEPLGSSNPIASASKVAWTVETVSRCIAQASLELLASSDPLAFASQSAGITGLSHCAWPPRPFSMMSPSVTQAGVQWRILGSPQPLLLDLSDSPTSASRVAETTNARHHAWLIHAITKKQTVPLMLLVVADVVGLVVMATVLVTVAVVNQEIPRRGSPTGHQCGCFGRRDCFGQRSSFGQRGCFAGTR
ncbi:hypothetical protein AAY473_040366, partial [Plecturocebus cupreus]